MEEALDRRELMGGGGAMVALASTGAAHAASSAPGVELQVAARQAWLYGLPLLEIARVRTRILSQGRANQLVHFSELTTAANQLITSPNNDTLYSRGFIDLRDGPVRIILPRSGERYLSLALMDMYSNNFAILGTRTTGPSGGSVLLAGPDDAAPPGALRSPTPFAYALGRTLVGGPADLAAAQAVQRGLAIAGPTPSEPPAQSAARDGPWRTILATIGALMRENPPPATDEALLKSVAPLGLSRDGFSPPTFSAMQIRQIEAGIAEAQAIARPPTGGLLPREGWLYPPAHLGRFEQDYLFRAQIALTGLFALTVNEAFYTRSLGDDGSGFYRGEAYRMHFAPGALPPVDGFWSLTLYEAHPDGRLFFAPNALDRYSLGDRSESLERNPDGSLDIWITRADPGPARRDNWLPAPRQAPFVLAFRAFLPRAPMQTGSYRLPPVEPV